MKKLFAILCASAILTSSIATTSNAQVNSQTGHTNFNQRQATCKAGYPYTVTNMGFDTLVSVGTSDTGYIQFQMPYKMNKVFDLFVTSLTGTLAATAVVMSSSAQSMPSPVSTTWKVMTGAITTCTTCIGSTATVSGAATTNYQWQFPDNADMCQNFQVRVITTGTCTGTYTSTLGVKN